MEACFLYKIFEFLLSILYKIFPCLKCCGSCALSCYRFLLFRAHKHPLLTHICYFISVSFLGYLALKSLPFKDPHPEGYPSDLDLYFTSVSAATVSSMSTVEMEVFSNTQLLVLAVLMLIGGEVLTSTVGLLFNTQQIKQQLVSQINPNTSDQVELSDLNGHLEAGIMASQSQSMISSTHLKCNAIKCLAVVLIGYLLSVHIFGSVSIILYISLVSSARDILRKKDLNVLTFSIFTAVSSFSSCGFIPTNENMMVFKKNTGLLLLIIPLVLLGNTIFPPALRLNLWVLKKLTKRSEYGYLLESSEGTGYYHLLPNLHSVLLVFTVVGFTVIQLIVICSMEWHSKAFGGMSSYQKAIGALFLSVNSRHTGESIVDLSSLSQAVLVLFVIMMYLPPYTAFIPTEDENRTASVVAGGKKRLGLGKSLLMSQLSCLAIFVILICITEKGKLLKDPLNFNVLNIVVEVIRQDILSVTISTTIP